MGWSKLKFIYRLWHLQIFSGRQRDDLHSVKLIFVPAKNIFGPVKGQGMDAIQFLIWPKKIGMSQNIQTVKRQGINLKTDF